DAGIPIAMGPDTMLEADTEESVQHELEYYVEAGLTPMQAIEIATKNGAEHLGIADRKGLVKEGLEADLILLEKDPAEDITNIRFIDKVFAKGKTVLLSAAKFRAESTAFIYGIAISVIRTWGYILKQRRNVEVT
ncbi:MAG: amidohydrolase family protein, partial [Candidatus Scatosoma sp.]